MSLAFPLGAAVVAVAGSWPASAAVHRYSKSAVRWLNAMIAAPTTVLAVLTTVFVRPPLVACAACWLAICAVPLAVIDISVRRLPDALTSIAFAGVAGFLLAAAATGNRWPDLARAGGGAIAVAGLFLLLAVIKPGSAGLGDAKLALSIGALAGWLGWPDLIAAIFAGFLLAGCYAAWLLATRRASLRTSLAYGPFLLAGCFAAVFISR